MEAQPKEATKELCEIVKRDGSKRLLLFDIEAFMNARIRCRISAGYMMCIFICLWFVSPCIICKMAVMAHVVCQYYSSEDRIHRITNGTKYLSTL